MKSRISFIWNEDLYPNVLEEDSSMEMKTNDFNEGIGLFLLFKEKYGFCPYGFVMMTYEIENLTINIIKNKFYILNGKKVPSEEVNWMHKRLRENTPYFVYIDDNFCIPYNEDTMVLLSINI